MIFSVFAASAGPSCIRSSPPTRTCVRSASATVLCARCSTSRIAVPTSRISVNALKIASTAAGAAPERRADGELLLLPAGQRPGLTAPNLAQDREKLESRGQGVADVWPPARRQAETKVLLDREVAEDPPAFRHERDPGPRDRLGRAAPAGLPG